MKRKILFIILILIYSSCSEKDETFKLTLSEGIVLVEPTTLDFNKVQRGTRVTVFLRVPDDKSIDTFTLNGVDKQESIKDSYYTFFTNGNTNISITFKKYFKLNLLNENLYIRKPENLNLDKVKDGEIVTVRIKVNVENSEYIQYFKKNETAIEKFNYELEEDKIYADLTFTMEEKSDIDVKISTDKQIPLPPFYDVNGNDIIFAKREIAKNLEDILIPNFVTEIAYGAFENCSQLNSVVLQDGLKKINSRAFYQCSGLTSINIPDGISHIETSTFQECENLNSITIGANLRYFGEDAFSGTPWLDNQISSNGECIVNNTLVRIDRTKTSYQIPQGVEIIATNAFFGCQLAEIDIPDSVTILDNEAFSGCNKLESIHIPESVTTIGDFAFMICPKLKTIIIPNSVTNIGSKIFFVIPYPPGTQPAIETIKCRATSQPEGWNDKWNYSNATVIWGYTGD